MRLGRFIPAAFLFPLAVVPATAQEPMPWVQVQTSSAIVGIGGQSGDGQLTLPNLGSNCIFPFKVSGFGAGLQVGVSQATATGPAQNLTKLADFPGSYSATHGEATILAGGGGTTMKNNNSPVTITLTSQTSGLNIGVSGQGMTIAMPVPPVEAPRTYVLEFGYNKYWMNKANSAKLNEVLAAWKCTFTKIKIVGHSDAVGKEDENLQLSVKRATAVRDYLLGAGVYPTRIEPLAAGENNQRVPTYQGQRLRANRVVVVTIE